VSDEWMVGCRYLSEESISVIIDREFEDSPSEEMKVGGETQERAEADELSHTTSASDYLELFQPKAKAA
jgi:hypothetical protein